MVGISITVFRAGVLGLSHRVLVSHGFCQRHVAGNSLLLASCDVDYYSL